VSFLSMLLHSSSRRNVVLSVRAIGVLVRRNRRWHQTSDA
jgi:hypothetical protein